MKIVLVTPPYYYLFSGAGIPRLGGFLKGKGVDVVQYDLDERVYRDLLGGENLARLFSRIEGVKDTLPRQDLARLIPSMMGEGLKRYPLPSGPEEFLEDILKRREGIREEIEEALTGMEEVYLSAGEGHFIEMMDRVNLATLLFSIAHFPLRWSLIDGFQFIYSPQRVNDILSSLADEEGNLLLPYFRERAVPDILGYEPDMVGISLNHFSQFIPGLSLCHLIREFRNGIPIILGGETLTEVSRFLPSHPGLFHLFDFIALGKGEYTLEGLAGSLPPERVPNLLYVQDGRLIGSDVKEDVDLNTLPTPDFTIRRPNPIIPLSLSSGCIWARCNFCFYPFTQTRGDYRGVAPYQERSLEKVTGDMKTLEERFSPTLFYFTDHSIPFKRLMKIGEGLEEKGVSAHFFSFIRADEEFTSLENCLSLKEMGFIGGYFGLESASQRVNDLMNKGIEVARVEKILLNFHDAGLISSIFCIMGFPGERMEEAKMTVEFLTRNRHLITGDLSLGNFHMKYNTPIFRSPEKFSVTEIRAPRGEDFPLRFNYSVKAGLTQEETSLFVKNVYRDMGLSYLSDRLLREIILRLVGE